MRVSDLRGLFHVERGALASGPRKLSGRFRDLEHRGGLGRHNCHHWSCPVTILGLLQKD